MKNGFTRFLAATIVASFILATSCSKRDESGTLSVNEGSGMKYATVFHPDIQMDQYCDTTVSVQLVAKYVSGLPEAITIGVRSYPEWVKLDSVSSIPTTDLMDTAVFNVKSLNLRLHPFNSGSYAITFFTKGATSDTQAHTINITVRSASDCTTYLLCRKP